LFTKYPNPNPQNTFWKILKKTHPQYFWDFYKDKARREFLQRLYRALRSQEDHVFVLSPDSRVLEAVKDLQVANKPHNFYAFL
jgi:Rad3-related DNA helicase